MSKQVRTVCRNDDLVVGGVRSSYLVVLGFTRNTD
jgi:hypothetical protein